jgi:hypothetical protein
MEVLAHNALAGVDTNYGVVYEFNYKLSSPAEIFPIHLSSPFFHFSTSASAKRDLIYSRRNVVLINLHFYTKCAKSSAMNISFCQSCGESKVIEIYSLFGWAESNPPALAKQGY